MRVILVPTERHDFIFDPLHYLALIEQKINALDRARATGRLAVAGRVRDLRRLLEARMGKQGKREFVQVLRVDGRCSSSSTSLPRRADAIARGAIAASTPVKHLITCATSNGDRRAST